MAQKQRLLEKLKQLRADSPSPPPEDEEDVRFKRELEEKVSDDFYQSMQEQRHKLPVYAHKEEMCRTIAASENQVVVISGETGCGKSTQIPQYILDEYIMEGRGSQCRILCTQPRRISTINLAHRVAEERAERCGGPNSSIGYQIRLESNLPREKGSILYCTTGIILKMMESQPNLDKISHLILDEIHERDIYSELIIILMKEILPERPDLKLILMSATLQAELFSQYYDNCPRLEIPGIIHPIEEYHVEDVVELISYKSPERPGKLKPVPRNRERMEFEAWLRNLDPARYSRKTRDVVDLLSRMANIDLHLVKDLIRYIAMTQDDGAILVFMPGWKPIVTLQDMMLAEQLFRSEDAFVIHIMHSGLMSTEDLQRAFDEPPPGVRKVVIATNVAETSLTIPDIVYVIDCGKINLLMYEARRNLSELKTMPNSKANARQRKGRAGRVGPGKCYYLYTQFEHERFVDFHKPEILRIRLEDLCLQIKLLRHEVKIEPFLQNAMSPPRADILAKSIDLLYKLNALDGDEQLTPLGVQLAQIPVNPHIGRMILFAAVFGCLDPILTVAACLDYKSPCYTPKAKEKRNEAARKKLALARNTYSDHLMFINAYNGWCEAKENGNAKEFCKEFFLSNSILKEIKKRREQFAGLLCQQGFLEVKSPDDATANAHVDNENLLRAVLCAGLYPNVAIIHTTRKVEVAGYCQHYYNIGLQGNEVDFGEKSVNFECPLFPFQFVIFYEIMKTSQVYIFDSTGVSLNPLIFFGDDLQIKRLTDGGNVKMAIDNWTFFETTTEKALDLQNLRNALWTVLLKKFDNPEPTDSEEEAPIMNKVLRLITADESVVVGDELEDASV